MTYHIPPSLVVPKKGFEYLDDKLLDGDGHLKLHPTSFYDDIDRLHLRIWCCVRARYLLPTQELVAWLKEQIGNRKAIEIGAGNGDLCHHLGIQGVDNACQLLPDVRLYYDQLGQTPTNPPPDVVRMDAVDAIKKFKPDVVLGAYITQKWYADTPETVGGNVYGPAEEEIIAFCDYLHIGNWQVAKDKRIRKFPHQEFHLPWVVTRAADPTHNEILYWKCLTA